jgi:hypothetical protein
VFFWRFKIVFMAVAPVSMTGPEVVTVDGLGDDRRPVAHQVGDLFDGDVVIAHDRDEGVA